MNIFSRQNKRLHIKKRKMDRIHNSRKPMINDERENEKELFILFVDARDALESISNDIISINWRNMAIHDPLRELIIHSQDARINIQIRLGFLDDIHIGKWVNQSWYLSPSLFNFYIRTTKTPENKILRPWEEIRCG